MVWSFEHQLGHSNHTSIVCDSILTLVRRVMTSNTIQQQINIYLSTWNQLEVEAFRSFAHIATNRLNLSSLFQMLSAVFAVRYIVNWQTRRSHTPLATCLFFSFGMSQHRKYFEWKCGARCLAGMNGIRADTSVNWCGMPSGTIHIHTIKAITCRKLAAKSHKNKCYDREMKRYCSYYWRKYHKCSSLFGACLYVCRLLSHPFIRNHCHSLQLPYLLRYSYHKFHLFVSVSS